MFQCFFEALQIPGYNHDVRAFLSEETGGTTTQTLRSTGNENGLEIDQLTV